MDLPRMGQSSLSVMWWTMLSLMTFGYSSYVCGNTETIGVCAMPGCNCSIIVHHWINIKCIFAEYQDIELLEGSIPVDASEISVSRCHELKIHSGALTGGAQLKRVRVSKIYRVIAKGQAFSNISAPNPLLEVSGCNRVIMESHAFKNAGGTLSVSISRCQYVEIQSNVFSWLLKFMVMDVSTLNLSSNAFKFESSSHGRHGPATRIMFQRVRIPEFPSGVFPSAAAEIRMDDIWTRFIREDAFCAMTIISISISNSSISQIESGAFSEKTLIRNFELDDVNVETIKTSAIMAGVTNFSIQFSKFTNIETGAVDIPAATVTLNNNEFHNLRKHSITFKQWSHISVNHNLFTNLEGDAIIADIDSESIGERMNSEFFFQGNHIIETKKHSLEFTAAIIKADVTDVGNNYFEQNCSCLMEDWVRRMTTRETIVTWIMETSFCVASEWLKKCFKVSGEYFAMRNFTERFCGADGDIECMKESGRSGNSIRPLSVGPHAYPERKIFDDVELGESDKFERERRLFLIVSVGTIFTIAMILIISGVFYTRRHEKHLRADPQRRDFSKSRFRSNTDMTSDISNCSSSRLKTSGYTSSIPGNGSNESETGEIHIWNTENQESSDDSGGTHAITGNKATQTLPEELTEEYLKDLRERLNDPDDYSQARDKIEHLYDLIKIEESCNNNNNDFLGSVEGGNTHDLILPRIVKSRKRKPSVHVGTRVPSLEKLWPSNRELKLNIGGYMEPKDHQDSNRSHTYMGSPWGIVSGSIQLSRTDHSTPTSRIQLALTPDVINDHLMEQPLMEKNRISWSSEGNGHSAVGANQQQLNSSQVFGDSNVGSSEFGRLDDSYLCEYSHPNDTTVHIYSELLDLKEISMVNDRMMNRPLPIRPDQEIMYPTKTKWIAE